MKNFTYPFKMIQQWKFVITMAVILGCSSVGHSQEVAVQVSYDTVYLGNILAVRFSMENWRGDMVDPDFGDFTVAGGPRISSSMSYSGGERKSSKTIIFHLAPPENPGKYQLPPIIFKGENGEFSTPEIPIVVMENPNGIEQDPAIDQNRPYLIDKEFDKFSYPPRGQRQRF